MVTSIEPKVAPTGRYTVKQTCECLGIHRNTLRRYTDEGHIKCSFRREKCEKNISGKRNPPILELPALRYFIFAIPTREGARFKSQEETHGSFCTMTYSPLITRSITRRLATSTLRIL